VYGFDDGLGFIHIAIFDGTADPFTPCAAYQEFHRDLRQRLAAAPTVMRAVLIGAYRAGYAQSRRRDSQPDTA
jgi:hypothetical protein